MKIKPNFLSAWVFLTTSLALHVVDEALNDFLSIYNPLVSSLNEKLVVPVFPVFSFSVWLAGLIIAIIILFGLSYFAAQQKKWILYFGYFYGVVMLLNGLGHCVGSLYYSTFIGGAYSSPLLLIGAVYLMWSANEALRKR